MNENKKMECRVGNGKELKPFKRNDLTFTFVSRFSRLMVMLANMANTKQLK